MSEPSKKMIRVLDDIEKGRGTHHNCSGRSEHGGRSAILSALMRRGLLDTNCQVTESGYLELSYHFHRKWLDQ